MKKKKSSEENLVQGIERSKKFSMEDFLKEQIFSDFTSKTKELLASQHATSAMITTVNRNPGAGTVDKTPEDTQLISTALERKLRRQDRSKGTERSTDSNRSCTREFEPLQ